MGSNQSLFRGERARNQSSQSSSTIKRTGGGQVSSTDIDMSSEESDTEDSRWSGIQEGFDLETDRDIRRVLNYLMRGGHIRFLHDDSDSDDNDLETYLSQQRSLNFLPCRDSSPKTDDLDLSDLKKQVLLDCGLSGRSEILPNFPKTFTQRELGNGAGGRKKLSRNGYLTPGDKCLYSSILLPNKMSQSLAQYPSKAFCGFYSKDGNLFLTACQDSNIRLYDTRYSGFKLIKTVWAKDVGWSILDTDISPDGRHFIYTSWSEFIYLCNIYGQDGQETHEALSLMPYDHRFCIFSCRFSQDGSEILGGANDACLYIYDRECHSKALTIKAHEDDVNAVSFADESSKILFSGSDDGLVKVWDRRTLIESNPKPVGVLAGHQDGITYIDSKGDGRHLISNCKDQSIKLWDMRKFSSSDACDETRIAVAKQNWDYRWQAVPRKLNQRKKELAGDSSLMTYRGHSVLQTLVRCHFSPAQTTGQRYIITGCASGRVIIYDLLTGSIIRSLSGHRGCVRDVSWHPLLPPEIISTSWDGTIKKWNFVDPSAFYSDDEDMEDEEDKYGRKLRRSKRIKEKKKRNAACLQDISHLRC